MKKRFNILISMVFMLTMSFGASAMLASDVAAQGSGTCQLMVGEDGQPKWLANGLSEEECAAAMSATYPGCNLIDSDGDGLFDPLQGCPVAPGTTLMCQLTVANGKVTIAQGGCWDDDDTDTDTETTTDTDTETTTDTDTETTTDTDTETTTDTDTETTTDTDTETTTDTDTETTTDTDTETTTDTDTETTTDTDTETTTDTDTETTTDTDTETTTDTDTETTTDTTTSTDKTTDTTKKDEKPATALPTTGTGGDGGSGSTMLITAGLAAAAAVLGATGLMISNDRRANGR